MKRTAIGICLLSALSGAALAAQLYRWVDEKGNVEWRDTPPPANAKKVEQRRLSGGSQGGSTQLPYSLQVAVKNYPVTLWTSTCGQACDQAKAHLTKRGIPYTEKDPQEDFSAFQKATGGSEVPVLFVGATRLKGYLDEQWDATLDAAGYPKTALPGVAKPAAKPTIVTPAPAEGQPPATPAQ
jgi:glutaredoxin